MALEGHVTSLAKTRHEAKANYLDILNEAKQFKNERAVMRRLCELDLYYLLSEILSTHVLFKNEDLNQDWIYDRVREVEMAPNGYLDLWGREHFKMQRLDEPTPTPSGWKLHGELKVGDDIFGPDGNTCKVVGLGEIVTDEQCYEIEFDDGTKIQCGADHIWEVERRTKKRIPMAYKSAGPKRKYRESVLLKTSEIALHNHKPDRRLSIRIAEPLVLPEVELPVHPYVLGVWLGDGSRGTPNITVGKEDHDEQSKLLSQCGIEVHSLGRGNVITLHLGNGTRWHKGSNDFTNELRKLGVFKNKHIPKIYLRSSIEQRLSLLQGLMDTDGTCNNRGTATFTSIDEGLVDNFVELAQTLSLKPNKKMHTLKLHGSPYQFFQVSFQAYKEFPPFKLSRKLSRCKEGIRQNARRFIMGTKKIQPVPMRCIKVDRPDGMYLTSKSMVPTHNSCIISFGLTIQDVLIDPEVTVGFFSFNRPIAKTFLRQIKREFEDNKLLIGLFPDRLYVNPEKESPKWSEDDGLVLRRNGNPKESTIEAWGLVESQPTSRHFQIRVYDDIITEKYVTNEDQIKNATESWELSLNLGSAFPVKRYGIANIERYIGTRYHTSDTYAEIMKRKAAIPRLHPATKDGTEDGDPVLWTKEFLMKKRRSMSKYAFGSQLLLDPAADKVQGFDEEWLQYWKPAHLNTMNLYLLVDPANSKGKKSDYTSMAVIALGPDQNYRLVDGLRDRLNLTERTRHLFRLHRKYRPKAVVGYEQYGMQADIAHIKEEMKRETYNFPIIPLGGNIAKLDRIRRFIPVAEQGRFFIPDRCLFIDNEKRQQDFTSLVKQEWNEFPVGEHEDILDMISRIVDPELGARFPMETDVDGSRGEQTHTDNSSPHYGAWRRQPEAQQTQRQTFWDVMWRR